MAYVISICGAGGKTTLCFEKAKYYLSMNKTVAITTTTHMYNEDFLTKYEDLDFTHIDKSKIYFIASDDGVMVKSLNIDEYNEICKHFDIVIVEADGSKSMPMKIIKGDDSVSGKIEPAIPYNANEIIVVMGKQAIGRKLETVCHNFDKYKYRLSELKNKNVTGDTIVTEELLNEFAEVFYINYLKNKFKNVKMDIYLSDMTKNENYKKYKKIAFAVAASGFSKRFGENKLFYEINGRALYQHTFDLITDTIKMLVGANATSVVANATPVGANATPVGANACGARNTCRGERDTRRGERDTCRGRTVQWTVLRVRSPLSDYNIKFSFAYITQYDLNFTDDELNSITSLADFKIINNPHPEIGMSESVKIATREFYDYDAICYLNADMPFIRPESFANMIYNYIHSNKGIGAMCVDSVLKNPAIFDKKYFDEILTIEGDSGPRALLTKYTKDCYFYHIDKDEMVDLDEKIL